MRVLVAVVLVIGFGILRVSAVTGNVAWAWVSVGVSVTAVVILAVDWRRTLAAAGEKKTFERFADASVAPADPVGIRGVEAAAGLTATEGDGSAPEPMDTSPLLDAGHSEAVIREADGASGEQALEQPAPAPIPHEGASVVSDATEVFERVRDHEIAGDGGVAGNPAQVSSPPGEEHADEQVSAAVARRDDEVIVVDEFPRYHLPGCRWLDERPTMKIPAREAVELGFTPCEVCTPARKLSAAAAERAVQAS